MQLTAPSAYRSNVSRNVDGIITTNPYFPGSSAASVARSSSSGASLPGGIYDRLQSVTAANNAWSAAQAQRQMDFQSSQGAIARQFNHDEAELSRLWQERMSNTAHQREVKDLKAAGLNPVLSAMGGNGAPVTSGATASGYSPGSGSKGDTDTSLASALVGLLGHVMQTQASMANAVTSAQAMERVADIGLKGDVFKSLTSAASAREVANIQGQTQRTVATINAGATVTSANIHAAAQTASARIAGQYNLSVAKTNQLTGIITHAMDNAKDYNIAAANRDLQRELQQAGFEFQMQFAEDQYTRDWKLHMWDNAADLLGDVIRGEYGKQQAGISGLSRLIPFLF